MWLNLHGSNMKVTEVSNDDGRMMAQLINFLGKGRWDLSGADAEQLVGVKRWCAAVAGDMARDLSPEKTPAAPESPSGGFRVKAVGPLPGKATKRRKK